VCDIHLDTPKNFLLLLKQTKDGRPGLPAPNAVLFIIALNSPGQQALFYMFFAFLLHFRAVLSFCQLFFSYILQVFYI